MNKKIDTAASVTVVLEDGQNVVVQELSFMGTLKALKIIRKIIAKAKELGSLDSLIESFKAGAAGGDLDRILEAMNMLFGVLGDEPTILPELISMCLVGDWDAEKVGDLPTTDVLLLAKSVYDVNWVQGSLKKALAQVGLKFEEKAESPILQMPQKQLSEKPVAEKTSTTAAPSTS